MICTNIICRDSKDTIEGCISSLAGVVDFVNITDTGSKDGTIRLITKTCKKLQMPYKLTHFDWVDDFAAARDYNFSQAPPESEWYLWVDADDTVEEDVPGKLRMLAEKAPPEAGAVWFPYFYASDEFGNATTVFIRERLLRASVGWKWQSRVHETVVPQSQCMFLKDNGVIIRHHHTRVDSRGERNFGLLHKMLEEEPDNKRVWLYMGHQHFAGGEYHDASEWYMRFGSDPTTLPIERFQALTYAARALRIVQDFTQAINCDLMAMEMYPQWADPYIGLCLSYNGLGLLDKSVYWGEQAKTKGIPDEVIFINPLDYTFNVNMGLFEASSRLGDMDKAEEVLREAIAVRPVPELQQNLELVMEAKERKAIVYGIKALCNTLIRYGERFKLRKVLDVMPFWMEDIPETAQLREGVMQQSQVPSAPESELARFFTGDGSLEYQEVIECNILEHIDTPLDFALAKLEQHADRVKIRIGRDGYRIITQQEMERTLVMPSRNINQLHMDEGVLVVDFDHNVPADTGLIVKVFCGRGFEQWTPLTIAQKGCGGSEISVAYLSKELVKKGNRVIVNAEASGVYDGVVYRPEFNPQLLCDLFIASRVPQVLNDQVAGVKLLWMHDIHCGPVLTPEIAQKIDGIVVLSRWHLNFVQSVYPWLRHCEVVDLRGDPLIYKDNPGPPPGTNPYVSNMPKIFILCDSIEVDRYKDWDEERVPHRFIWMSSPDRGLLQVLQLWPKIRESIPDAELKIFYGWEYFDVTLRFKVQADLKKELLPLLEQDGVEWCGRVNPDQLAVEYKRAGVWLYPPPHEFRETCCIASMEAQASGVLCFYRMNGALGETIGNRGIPLPLDSTPEQIVEALVSTLTDENKCAKLRRMGKRWAMQHSYESMADNLLRICKGCKGEQD